VFSVAVIVGRALEAPGPHGAIGTVGDGAVLD